MIRDHTLDLSILEAVRYIKAARALRKARRSGKPTTATHAATKRASMDLSRILADVRQSR